MNERISTKRHKKHNKVWPVFQMAVPFVKTRPILLFLRALRGLRGKKPTFDLEVR
jgi:hypothetical protein